MGLKVGTVRLEDYNPEWKNSFEVEKNNLINIFKEIALKIEHVGSTSIEGLSAKPITATSFIASILCKKSSICTG